MQRYTYHEEGCDDPVDKDTEANLLPDLAVRKDPVESLVAHLAQDRVHHDEQANGYRDRHVDELSLLQGRANVRDEVAKDDADGHGEEDPEGEEPVEPAQRVEGRAFLSRGIPRLLGPAALLLLVSRPHGVRSRIPLCHWLDRGVGRTRPVLCPGRLRVVGNGRHGGLLHG